MVEDIRGHSDFAFLKSIFNTLRSTRAKPVCSLNFLCFILLFSLETVAFKDIFDRKLNSSLWVWNLYSVKLQYFYCITFHKFLVDIFFLSYVQTLTFGKNTTPNLIVIHWTMSMAEDLLADHVGRYMRYAEYLLVYYCSSNWTKPSFIAHVQRQFFV